MPKKSMSRTKSSVLNSAQAATKMKMIFAAGALLLVVLGLVVGYVSLQNSQDNRDQASVPNGQASIALEGPNTAKPGDQVRVAVYLSTKANLSTVHIAGKFTGVGVQSARFESAVPAGSSQPAPTVAPTQSPKASVPPVQKTSKPPTLAPTPIKTKASTPPVILKTTKVKGVSTEIGSTIITSNQVTNGSFVLDFAASRQDRTLPVADRQLLGTFIIVPSGNGELVINFDDGTSQALIFGSRADTLSRPTNFKIMVGTPAAAAPNQAPKTAAPPIPATTKPGTNQTPVLRSSFTRMTY